MSSMCTRASSERRPPRAVTILLLALAAAACQRPNDPPEVQAARATVLRYNDRLPLAFRTGNQAVLGDVAEEAEAGRVGALVTELASRGQVMFARLLDLKIESAKMLGPNAVLVETAEAWTYEHRKLDDRDRPVEPARVTYRMSYQVSRESGAWRVQVATPKK